MWYLFAIKLPSDGNHRNNRTQFAQLRRYRVRILFNESCRPSARGEGEKGEKIQYDLISHLRDFDAKRINISFEQNKALLIKLGIFIKVLP